MVIDLSRRVCTYPNEAKRLRTGTSVGADPQFDHGPLAGNV